MTSGPLPGANERDALRILLRSCGREGSLGYVDALEEIAREQAVALGSERALREAAERASSSKEAEVRRQLIARRTEFERADSERARAEGYRKALELIAEMPTRKRNPNGEEQATDSIQVIAREALRAGSGQPKEET